MFRVLTKHFVLLAVILVLQVSSEGFAEDNGFDAQALEAWLDESLGNRQAPGFSAVITKDNQVIFEYTHGANALERGEAVTNRHVFHQASISKAFVAVAVMRLVQDGKLALDDRVNEYLPYLELEGEGAADITIRQLLSHTAGISDVEDYEWDNPQYDERALENWVRTFPDRALLFEPGSQQQYSNIGFEILGDVISKVAGMPFTDAMDQLVLQPLGMKDSTFYYPDVVPALRTWGHYYEWDAATETASMKVYNFYPYNRRHGPSSTLNSNAADMAKWLIFFATHGAGRENPVLSTETITLMWTPQFQINDNVARALGWGVGTALGVKVAGHAGGDDGFHTNMRILPDHEIGLAFMTNTSWHPGARTLFDAMQLAALGRELPPVLERPTAEEFSE